MPWNGFGTFSRDYNWTADRDAGIKIRADRMDDEFDNFATGLENCWTLDGQNTPTQNMPMGGYKFTNVADATVATEFAAYGQLTDRVATVAPADTSKVLRGDGTWSSTLTGTQTLANLTVTGTTTLSGTVAAGTQFTGNLTFSGGATIVSPTISGTVTMSSTPVLSGAMEVQGNIVQSSGQISSPYVSATVISTSTVSVTNGPKLYGHDGNPGQFGRLAANFDEATLGERTRIITTNANPAMTEVLVTPSSGGTKSGLYLTGVYDPDNSGYLQVYCDSSGAKSVINSSKTGTGTAYGIEMQVSGNVGLAIDQNQNVQVGKAIADTGTNGFMYIPTLATGSAGTPASATINSCVPMFFDDTDNKIKIYSGGTWIATAALS